MTEASQRQKVTVSVLKDSLDRQFQLQMAVASSFSRLVRTLAANVSPEQLEQARTLTLLRGVPGATPLPPLTTPRPADGSAAPPPGGTTASASPTATAAAAVAAATAAAAAATTAATAVAAVTSPSPKQLQRLELGAPSPRAMLPPSTPQPQPQPQSPAGGAASSAQAQVQVAQAAQAAQVQWQAQQAAQAAAQAAQLAQVQVHVVPLAQAAATLQQCDGMMSEALHALRQAVSADAKLAALLAEHTPAISGGAPSNASQHTKRLKLPPALTPPCVAVCRAAIYRAHAEAAQRGAPLPLARADGAPQPHTPLLSLTPPYAPFLPFPPHLPLPPSHLPLPPPYLPFTSPCRRAPARDVAAA